MSLSRRQELVRPGPEDDARLVIETMYQVAADPQAWEQLVDVLPEGGPVLEPTAEDLRQLALGEDLARLAREPGDGPAQTAPARSGFGWLVLSSGGRLLACNAAAREVLGPDLAGLEFGREIAFLNPENDEALAQALVQARVSRRAHVIVRLVREIEDGPSFAYLTPARALPAVAGGDLPDLALDDDSYALVLPAASETSRMWTSIRDSFGLTAAELRLARKLRDGRSLQDAADELAVSVNTVRNQLRAVFEKMGLKRQSELVRALTELSLLAGVIEDPGQDEAEVAPPVRSILLPDGRRLAYREYGDAAGKALLTFHEGLGSSLLPPGTDAAARALGLRIVCAERPGFGQSDPRPDYSFEGVAEDMVELCDRLGLDEVRLGAVLSGAPFAIATAARMGPRVRKVMIYSGRPPRSADDPGRNPLTLFRRRIEDNPWVLETFFSILRLRVSPSAVERLMRRASAGSPGDLAYLDAHPEAAAYVASYVGEALARSSRGPADEVRAFRRGRNMNQPVLAAPLVVWHGEQDRFAPLAPLLEFLGRRASEVHVVPGVGHFLCLKHWDAILKEAASI